MARKPRLFYPGAVYHVILRGNDRQDVFFYDTDRCRFYLLLQEGAERFGSKIVALCLMTNHAHLAVQVGEVPLSRILQNLSFRYTRWINWRMGRIGHLFQGRYKAFLVDQEQYLLELVAYIHLNPVRAGMVKAPENYQWSSHGAYLGREAIPWVASQVILGQFSKDQVKARQRFREFVDGKMDDGHRDEFHGKASLDNRFIARDNFVDEILGQTEPMCFSKPDVHAVLCGVKKLYRLTDEDLASGGQKRMLSEARMLAAWAVRELSCSTLTELARLLDRDSSAMSAAAARFEQRRKQDQSVVLIAEELKKELDLSTNQA